MFQVRGLSSGASFQAPMMTGWEQDVVTKRWRPSALRPEPLGRRDRRRGGEPRGRLPATLLADLAVDITVDLLGDRVWRGAPRMR
jgi:hypothetical protein